MDYLLRRGDEAETKTYTLFLIEDHATLRRFLRQMLDEEPDFNVIGEADSAEKALEMLEDASPDLVTVDLSLPGMSGLELIKILGERRSELRCLVLTGHADNIYKVAAAKAGAVGFVSKDDPDEVLLTIRNVLRG